MSDMHGERRDNRESRHDLSMRVVQDRLLTGPDGNPYPGLRVMPGTQAGARASDDNRALEMGDVVGPVRSVSGILHEIGHLMTTADERVGSRAWGVANPHMLVTIYGRLPVHAPGNPQIRAEARAWAWEHLMEVHCGLRDADTPVEHGEAQFLDEGAMRDKDAAAIAVNTYARRSPSSGTATRTPSL